MMSRRSEIVYALSAPAKLAALSAPATPAKFSAPAPLATLAALAVLLTSCTERSAELRPLGAVDGVPLRSMSVERLPDLPKPRGGHHTMLLGEELTVLGGITDGFVLEPTIAYLKDGTWQEVPMKYPHYYGFTTLLPDGNVMLGGGCSENFGIGQSWGVETYNPATHACKAVGIMDRKRAGASASALPDGRVVVAGNWYADDAIEQYEPGEAFSYVKEPAIQRVYPFILPVSPDNALILSAEGPYGERASGCIDQLDGEPFTEPLLDEWDIQPHPVNPTSADDLRIGEYSYLLPAVRREDGQAGILRLSERRFILLETDHPLPMALPDGEALVWEGNLQVDRASRSAWMYAIGDKGHFAAARIAYDPIFEGNKATLELYLADKPGGGSFFNSAARLLDGGRIVLAGGVSFDKVKDNNFEATGEVWLFHTTAPAKGSFPWWILLVILPACAFGCWGLFRILRSPAAPQPPVEDIPGKNDLLTRITSLIEGRKLYLVKDLKISDIARELGTNATYISACINGQLGLSFPELIARYRVEYAQELMRKNPEMPSVEVWEESGFNNEKTFFRCFRAQAGMTPAEWKKSAFDANKQQQNK